MRRLVAEGDRVAPRGETHLLGGRGQDVEREARGVARGGFAGVVGVS
jgi:hypothetical protein